jgi:FkbM family methyltransferase
MTAGGTAREKFFAGAGRFTPIVAAASGSARFLVRPGDETVGRTLFLKRSRGEMGTLERAVSLLWSLGLKNRVRESTFLDIGANIGTSGIPAVLWHPFESAVACEPEPSNYELLRLNVVLNHLERQVLTLPVAVSDEVGTAELALHTWNSGGHQVVAGEGPVRKGVDAPRGEKIRVEKVTLDHLVARGLVDAHRVGLMWIDTQGHEGHVLRGASALLELGTPTVIEFYPALLERAGGYDSVVALAGEHFTHAIDLRARRSQDADAEIHPASELERVAERFDEEHRFTDVLLVRREAPKRPKG